MARTLDLNSDIGEGFGPWKMGDDAALMRVITSANIACGFHAGDPDVMARTMTAALENNVGIGAHPGFHDLQGFGRRRIQLDATELQNLIAYQFGAAQGVARAIGGAVRHLKLHGALANMASEDIQIALSCYRAALAIDPDVIIIAMSATQQEQAVRQLQCNWAGEIFADRAYNPDGTLVDRRLPGAVLHDPQDAVSRIQNMLAQQAIIATDGTQLPTQIDTVCLHGDTPAAVAMATAIKGALVAADIDIKML